MKKIIENVTKFIIYTTFFVPLVVVPSSFIFPFIVPKILLFRSLISLALGGYILLLLINWQEYRPKFTPLNLVFSFFILSFAISTIAGADFYHSFWDNHERMLGFFTIFHYALYYFICSKIFKNWKDWGIALKIFLLAGSIVMFLCIPQIFDPDFLMNQGSDRTASTLGNSIYVSGYGLFLLFVSILLFLREKDLWWKVFEVGTVILALVGIFFGGSRGAILGLGAGVFSLVVGYVFVLKEQKSARRFLWIGTLAVFLIFAILFFYRQSEFVKKIPAVGRVFATSWEDVKNSPRMIAWQIAVEGWKERPIFGWGPNNFFYAFNKYYNPRSLEFGYSETWFDNAHNIILNTLTVQGAFGLVIYLSIFGIGISSLVIAYKKYGVNKHIVVVGGAFLIAHLVQNITVFENPTSYLYFMFWLAMINCLAQPNLLQVDKEEGTTLVDREIGGGSVATVLIIMVVTIFIFNIQPARANMKTLVALQKLGTDPILGLVAAKGALSFNSPHIDDIRSDLSRSVMQIVSSGYQQLGKDRSNEMINTVVPELQKNLKLHPMDIRNQMTLAQLVQIEAFINNDATKMIEAENYLTDALGYSPHRQQIIYAVASTYWQLGKNEDAAKLLEGALNDDPKVAESYWRLAYTYDLVGDKQKAREIIALADKNGIVFDQQGTSVIKMIIATSSSEKSTKK